MKNIEDVLKIKMETLLGEPDGFIDHSDLLFHYTRAETALAYILRSKTLKFNAMGYTNDPLENHSLILIGSQNEQAGRLMELADERQKGKLACFCVSPDAQDIRGWFDWGCFRSRMWSQYADNHRGVCLVFSKSELLDAADEWTRDRKMEFFKGPVGYDNKLEKLTKAHSGSHAESLTDRVKRHSEGYYFCKREDYRGEAEYRMVIYHQDLSPEETVHIPYKKALKGIILGSEFPFEDNDLFIEEARSLDVALAQVAWYSNPCLIAAQPCWRSLR